MDTGMTMQWPDTWVVGIELENSICWNSCRRCWLKDLCISSLRIVWVDDSCVVPNTCSLSKNPSIMTMQMHRMRLWECIVQYQSDGCIISKVVDCSFWIEGSLSGGCLSKNGLVVVALETDTVDKEQNIGSIQTNWDGQSLSCRWLCWCLWPERNCLR